MNPDKTPETPTWLIVAAILGLAGLLYLQWIIPSKPHRPHVCTGRATGLCRGPMYQTESGFTFVVDDECRVVPIVLSRFDSPIVIEPGCFVIKNRQNKILGQLTISRDGKVSAQMTAAATGTLHVDDEWFTGTIYITRAGLFRFNKAGQAVRSEFGGADVASVADPGDYIVKDRKNMVVSYATVDSQGLITTRSASLPPRE